MKEKSKEKNKKEYLQKIENLEKKNLQLEDNWKRTAADFQNFKRRTEQEKFALIKYSNKNLILEILPVLDNLEALLKHKSDDGLKVILNHFKDILKKIGVTEILVKDTIFDSKVCEAVDVAEGEENKVLEVLQKGFMYDDVVLRPARVIVGKSSK
ncbi:nucleotide exchange factor GrpE [candidate division WWE3 bacterium CG10_big_fil_rev_8_21_14_0_10_32_10]|uniref:Protein GrpE n=1 Tax=candidate division WWE3 bacterium CG10_big_fil_rev_8_21_14_0_10_32_10 TaxID=1975090 RepID=A0A2H0RB76_UNCKA|nr:MAG: nucleotide exchange factor GrpE [candidate division WWE3 bacterium CG10_big_fil_rev_8_21_14_0_10_32_10]